MKNYSVEFILSGDSSKLEKMLGRAGKGIKTFGYTARAEFDRIRTAARSLEGRLASLGISLGAMALLKQSAELDKNLTQIGQTAGEDKTKVAALRAELWRMSAGTGQKVEALSEGFDVAAAAGMKFKEIIPVMDAISKAMTLNRKVTSEQLASALTVAKTIYGLDLTKQGAPLAILDKMVVGGRLGRAELEKLSSAFSRSGYNAKAAGLSMEQHIALLEGLSYAEPEPERLGTLADSTLRLFTIGRYMKDAQQGSGIKFFDDRGGRRDPLQVLTDIRSKYLSLKTEAQKNNFMTAAFGHTDQDTIKGLRALFDEGPMMEKVAGEFVREIMKAGGTIERDLPDAMNNAVTQAGRLKNVMLETADKFSQILNKGITGAIKKMLDAKKDGGWGLSGEEIAAGGGGLLLAGYLTKRFGGKMGKAIMSKFGGSTAVGIGEGKLIEAATGVTPVFVVNMPAGFGAAGDMPGALPGAGNKPPSKLPTTVPKPGGRPSITLPDELFSGSNNGGGVGAKTGLAAIIASIIGMGVTEYRNGRAANAEINKFIAEEQAARIKSDINIRLEDNRTIATTNNMNTNVKVNTVPRGKF